MHHLVYIPKAHLQGVTSKDQLSAVGLADHAAGAQTVQCDGPDNGTGTLFGWGNRLHFNADEQSWTPAAQWEEMPLGRYWVGTFNASPPTPDDLKRPGRDAWGEPFTLGDGNTWLLPPIDMLPMSLAQFPDGTAGYRIKPEFAHLAEDRTRWMARLAGPPQMISLMEAARFVVSAMAIYYRLDATAALHLGLFDEVNLKDALKIVLRPRAFYAGE